MYMRTSYLKGWAQCVDPFSYEVRLYIEMFLGRDGVWWLQQRMNDGQGRPSSAMTASIASQDVGRVVLVYIPWDRLSGGVLRRVHDPPKSGRH